MNKILITAFLLVSVVLVFPCTAISDSADELIDQFGQEYEALKPAAGSSVNVDYPYRQTALSGFYSTKMMGLIYKQNQQLLSKYDEMLQKYDEIIRQNAEIIKLLSPPPPATPAEGKSE